MLSAPNLDEAPPNIGSEGPRRAGSVPFHQQRSPERSPRHSLDELSPRQQPLPQQQQQHQSPPPQAAQEDQIMSPPPPLSASHTHAEQLQQDHQLQTAPPPHHDPGGPSTPTPPGRQLSGSPPTRKDTNSSVSTQATAATVASAATNLSADTNNTSYSADTSPTLTSVFHVRDGVDVSNRVRASRRRTGPLSQQQREKAALIRKLGACNDCRRRRVAHPIKCHPSHHNMTWEDAVKKYHRAHSPTMPDIAPSLSGQRPLSPSHGLNVRSMFSHDPNEMEIDSPTGQSSQGRLSESRIRTPLPTGPRLEKGPILPGIESLKTDLQANVSRILSDPHRSRYTSVQALMLHWQDDPDPHVGASVNELAEVFDQYYRYTFDVQAIPSTSENCKSPWRWLSRKITDFSEDRDQRDVLKIVYYIGHTFLDNNQEMVLASSRDREKAETLRWDGIHQSLEEATGDTLILMDAPYYPSAKMTRHQGVLELIAAAGSEEHYNALDRCAFTKMIAEQMRTRASLRIVNPFSAAELHSKLMSQYSTMAQRRNHDEGAIVSLPSPLHLQLAGDPRLPSILLTPTNISPPRTSLPFAPEGQQLYLSIRVGDEPIDVDAWTEWLRNMPDGVKDLRVDGPYRPSR